MSESKWNELIIKIIHNHYLSNLFIIQIKSSKYSKFNLKNYSKNKFFWLIKIKSKKSIKIIKILEFFIKKFKRCYWLKSMRWQLIKTLGPASINLDGNLHEPSQKPVVFIGRCVSFRKEREAAAAFNCGGNISKSN